MKSKMDRKTVSLIVLTLSALFLLFLNFRTENSAQAIMTIKDRDYQVITARSQGGSDALYIVDNRRGMMVVFSWDAAAKTIIPRDFLLVQDAIDLKR